MARHSEPEMRTVAAIRLIAVDAVHAAREIESLCEMLDSDGVYSLPVKFFETATKGNTHLRSFGRSIREAIAEYHRTGEVVRKPKESDAAMIARVSAEMASDAKQAALKPKRTTKKKSG